jgi:long-chain-acyl-CoA dehydrogenase
MLNVESRSAYSSEHEIFRNSVCKFLDAEYVPYADQWEKDGVISRSFWLACGKAGMLCPTIPEAYGGLDLPRFGGQFIVLVS